MKIRLFSFIATCFVISFSSCQREVDGIIPDGINVDSTVIRKYIEFDTTLAAGLDTNIVLTFNYDNIGRLISIKTIEKDQSLPPTSAFQFFENTSYFYNANDKLPFKVLKANKDAFGTMNDTTYLFYANGYVVKDSIRMRSIDPTSFVFETILVNRYVVIGNTIVVTRYRDQTLHPSSWPPLCPGTTTYQQTVLNGNITSETGNYSSCSGIGMSEANFAYDSKPNPFYPLRIPYLVFDNELEVSNIQKNNITDNWFSTPADGYKYSYTYRADGYPIALRAYEVSDPTNVWKGLFIYK